jgi:transposase InsO family protein
VALPGRPAAHGHQPLRALLAARPPRHRDRSQRFSYVRNRTLRELLTRRGIRHLTTEPYRPRTNGKVERFHQTMAREWAYGLSYRSHHRNSALPHWLNHYNHRRPHTAISDRPLISRVHNVRG